MTWLHWFVAISLALLFLGVFRRVWIEGGRILAEEERDRRAVERWDALKTRELMRQRTELICRPKVTSVPISPPPVKVSR